MRIISLSVDGLHQAADRGLYEWLNSQDADIICLQDLRCLERETDTNLFHLDGYEAYFFDSGVKHYNGVAIYTRAMPKALIYGFGFSNGADMEGRYLQADFENLSVGSLLAPSAQNSIESQEVKTKFFDDLQAHLIKISRKRRDFIFCGNWAIAPDKSDVSDWTVQQEQSGFLLEEQQWMKQLPHIGYVDAFRQANSDKDEFSWWPSGSIDEGEAWRTDLQIASASLKNRVEYAMIYKKQTFSSHLPVIIDYDLELQLDEL
ncbi:MAG: exodeoxyribonuclease-3 [Cellvibrionaceae bacterium]|jgi:exodeoxyribonuclease-3